MQLGKVQVHFSFFNIGAIWASVVSAALQPLHPGKETPYALYKGLVGPKVGLYGCRKCRPPTRIRSLDCQDRSESLNRLRYPGSRSFNVKKSDYLPTVREIQSTILPTFILTEWNTLALRQYFRKIRLF